MKGIKDLDVSKASPENDILAKIIKEKTDMFSSFIRYRGLNNMIVVCISATSIKLVNFTSVFKKGQKNQRKIIDL